VCRDRPRGRRAAYERDELAAPHVWMAPAWQEKIDGLFTQSLVAVRMIQVGSYNQSQETRPCRTSMQR